MVIVPVSSYVEAERSALVLGQPVPVQPVPAQPVLGQPVPVQLVLGPPEPGLPVPVLEQPVLGPGLAET